VHCFCGPSPTSPHGSHIFFQVHHSTAKAPHVFFKTGPPAKKAVAVSMAKAKQSREQRIKKHVRIGKYFFY
jgi:hypothetical protein